MTLVAEKDLVGARCIQPVLETFGRQPSAKAENQLGPELLGGSRLREDQIRVRDRAREADPRLGGRLGDHRETRARREAMKRRPEAVLLCARPTDDEPAPR